MADASALDPHVSVSVSASAGTGKTWLLTARLLRLMLEGAAPSGILAVTFTRKAATEMRLRLFERLRELSRAPEPQLDDLLRALGVAPDATVRDRARRLYRELLFTAYPPRLLTLHAFCQDLLNRFALEAQVPPGFGLVETEAALARGAWRAVQAQIVREPAGPAARALDALIGMGMAASELDELMFAFHAHRADWWALTGEGGPLPHQRLMEQLELREGADPYAAIDEGAFNAWLDMLYRGLLQVGGVGSVKVARIEPALGLRGAERFAVLRAALFTDDGPRKFEPRQTIAAAQRKWLAESHGEVMQGMRAAADQAARRDTLRRTAAVCELGAALLDAVQAELARQQALTFPDLEWRTYLLLRRAGGAEWVRYKLDQKIEHLLIDEFQDTSSTQWHMLLPLLEDMAAGRAESGRSAFIVGDVKQSIYGFRRADPRLLPRAQAWIERHLDGRTAALNVSRRSAPAVIDFVNALFAPEALRRPLAFEPHGTHRHDLWGRVEVAPAIAPGEAAETAPDAVRDPLTAPRPQREDRRAALEAQQVIARIAALVAARLEIDDNGTGRALGYGAAEGRRALGYGDVMVLARNRTHLRQVEHALTAAGIPFVGAARSSLPDTAEARDVQALLRWLDAPHRDLDLAQALRSPLFALSDGMLVALAREARAGGGWNEALERLAPREPALRRPLELLRRWQALAPRLPVHDLLDTILRGADAPARYEAALPPVPAARVRANFGVLLQLALENDSGRYPSIAGYLRYLDDQAQGEALDEAPPAAAGDQVRVMTIHAAKGLEAPAVFLVNCGRIHNPRTPPLLVEWPDGAERPTHFLVPGEKRDRDALSEQLAQAHKQRETVEDLNLLYVAATRARQFLHVSGFLQANAGKRLSWHDHAASAMKLLNGSAALLVHANGEPATGAATPAPATPPPTDARLAQPLALELAPEPPPAAAVDAATAQRGIAVHFLLQQLGETRAAATLRPALGARLNVAVADDRFQSWLSEAERTRRAPELARFFDPARYRRAWNEVPVTLADGRAGVIDRLIDDGETLWVLDYKTQPRPDPPALAELHRRQLLAYAEAVAQIWPGRPVRAGLALTASGQWLEIESV